MTDQPVSQTGTSAKAPALSDDDKRAKAASLRAEADAIESALPPPPDTVQLKVEPPHEAFSYGGSWVTREWSNIHKHHVAAVMQAASDAGVQITQKG